MIEVKISKTASSESLILLMNSVKDLTKILSKEELLFTEKKIKNKEHCIEINRFKNSLYIIVSESKKGKTPSLESARKQGNSLLKQLNHNKEKEVSLQIINGWDATMSLAFIEGMLLSSYQFLKYLSKSDDKKCSVKMLKVHSQLFNQSTLDSLKNTVDAVFMARDLINEPVMFLNAPKLAEEIKKMGKIAGFKVEVFDKKKIESLKMGGILAVNRGSIDPPRFCILEWKPSNPKNKKPLILVGKGITFDTGGLSLKPTGDSMDYMKSDMSGAAAVAATLYAIAKNKIPVHVIGLIPSTDNRPDGNAYTPGDIIKMYDGTSVEVLNTDAEGRMILADALSYAKKYKPELVINIATLTGSAAAAIGKQGMVGMGNAPEKTFNKLKQSGDMVHERIAEFPFWAEYADDIKSPIADLKNVGGKYAGAITAGKFLEHFTDYPFIHLDIAGVAFIKENDSYRGKGGTGVCVRLLHDFISKY